MLLLKYLLLSAGIAMFVIAAGILSYDAYLTIVWQRRRLNFRPEAGTPGLAPGLAPSVRWRTSLALVMLAWAPLLISAGIVIVPSGMAGVRVSQTEHVEVTENNKTSSQSSVPGSQQKRAFSTQYAVRN